MEKNEIIEGNRLIAIFENRNCLGILDTEPFVTNIYFSADQIEQRERQGIKVELYYHSSWDWLMPVVEKIKKIAMDKDLELNGEFKHKEALSRYTPIGNECWNVNLENVHFCVIKFIQWYNQQTPKP